MKAQYARRLSGKAKSLFVLPKWRRSGVDALMYEVYLWWRFCHYDIAATVLPCLVFTTAAWRTAYSGLGFSGLGVALVRSCICFALFVYGFTLSNQLIGIEEDRANKPDRPLVAGICSPAGARVRWVVVTLIALVVGWWWNIGEWAACWLVLCVYNNFGGGGKHWFSKSLLVGLAMLVEMSAAWQLVTPLTGKAWTWIIFLSVAIFLLCPLADLRDMVGDQCIGRRTVPLVYGENVTRVWLSIGFSILPVAIVFVLLLPGGVTWYTVLCTIFQTAINGVMAWRVLFLRSVQADRYTYFFFFYWYTATLVWAIVLL